MVTIWVLIMAGAVFTFVGLIWDGGGKIDSFRSANEIAKEAARFGAEYVDVNHYLDTGVAVAQDSVTSRLGVQAYINKEIAGSNNREQIQLTDLEFRADGTVYAQVTVSRPLLFLGGFSTAATGQATVKLTQGVIDSGG